ncbi:uncharacterized protein LOC144668993 isoform X2 [Cetorhinus maximus]
MELNDEYENLSDFHLDEMKEDRGKHERLKPEHGVRSAEPIRGRWSPLITYSLLVISILLSITILGTAMTLLSQLSSEMKTSDASFEMKLSQLKSTVTGISEETNRTLAKISTEISLLKELAGMPEQIRRLLPELRTTIPELKKNLPHLQCPMQWTPFKQKLYYFSSHQATWGEAQRFCELMDANLAVINSAEEQMYIQWNIQYDHWIGLTDATKEGKWHWVDGTDYASNVKFWYSNQPNGGETEEDEDCVVTTSDGKWHDWPCSSFHSTICEKSA